ncbi:MAG: D-alanyl-D-alanine carboxypeptidase family protein [Xanthomonadales bacterium]|nr:D-alanyl-D-alanine carboxypeptidase family protein [Xanthomonadales bacterium]
MTSQPDLLLNGLRCALQISRPAGAPRASPPQIVLLDKASGRPLWQDRAGRSRQRPTRAALRELDLLRDRLRRPGRPGAAPDHRAWAAQATRALARLDIAADLPRRRGLTLCPEPPCLHAFGRDLADRTVWLVPAAGRAWSRMRDAAADEGIRLRVVSSWRSLLRQEALLRAKLAAGRTLAQVLEVNALPGYSEHHLGTTLDLHAGEGPVLEEAFEATAAFDWLQRHAGGFGFRLSYPRGNRHGIAYEPWHWRWHPP